MSRAVIPKCFSRSALRSHLGSQIFVLNANIAYFNMLTAMVVKFVRILISWKSARIYAGNTPIARFLVGGKKFTDGMSVILGKNPLIFCGRLLQMRGFLKISYK